LAERRLINPYAGVALLKTLTVFRRQRIKIPQILMKQRRQKRKLSEVMIAVISKYNLS
jgi:hypothetical protein